jgi:N-acetylmuramate 1-kinase
VALPANADASWRIDLPGEAATTRLAALVAEWVGPGDLIGLSGDLGAAKTTFARALIRRLTGDSGLEAPSPTFTLMQVYDGPAYPIVHADFYRIRQSEELFNLGWEEAVEGALTLVEWPDRAGDLLNPDRLDIAFELDLTKGADYRRATLSGRAWLTCAALRRSLSAPAGARRSGFSCRAMLRSGPTKSSSRRPARPRF